MKRKIKFKKIIGILAGILFLCILVYIFYSRHSVYNYNTSNDYQYDFSASEIKKIKLKLTNGKLVLPETDLIDQTIFLKLKINTSFLSTFFKPSIDIISNDKKITQHFEYGAEGIRYLNLTQLHSSKSNILKFEGDKINIKDQTVELILFKNQKIGNAKIMIIAPHPDDAEIAAYGMYAKHPDNSFIITITAGEAGYFKYMDIYKDSQEHSLKKGEIRTWNSITTPLLSGVPLENCINLGYFDTTLKDMFQNDTINISSRYIKTSDTQIFRKLNLSSLKDSLSDTSSNWKSLITNLKTLIKIIKPDIIITPHPQLDFHSDHQFATVAIIQALLSLQINKGHLFLYTNHLSNSEFYPFGKEGDPITLPPYFKNKLYFKSLYSNPLTISQQKDKIFALESMNDLRLNSNWRNTYGLTKIYTKTLIKDVLGIQDSYYRKSVRANELFFTLPINKTTLNNLLNKTPQ